MSSSIPRVSIGLAIYNGENFLREAIDSIMAQTFEDFELIISDNASTDKTEEICREYIAKDRRIRYYRNDKNLGAVRNFNQVFELSRGEYFKLAAHDDLCAPEYLEKCVRVLDRDPSVAVCHPKTSIINKYGSYQRDRDDLLNFRSTKPHRRFNEYLFRRASMWNAIFGLIRTCVLKKTKLFGNYFSSDQVLLGELVLRGKIYQVPDRLFFRRFHSKQSWRANPTNKEKAIWINPSNAGKIILPSKWRHFFEYFSTIRHVRLSWHEQTWCYLYMIKWGCKNLILSPALKYWRKTI